MRSFLTLIKRDIFLTFKEGNSVGTSLAFFLIVIVAIPLGLGPDQNLLSRIAPGILWIGLLLSALMSVDRIFQTDYNDGTLEAMSLGELPMEMIATAKSIAHAIATGLPLILAVPVLGLMLNLDLKAYGILMLSMLIGTPGISFIGALGSALTIGIGRGGVLIALLILPLCIPILIFGVSAVSTAITGPGSSTQPLLILTAITLALAVLGPVASAAAIRLQLG